MLKAQFRRRFRTADRGIVLVAFIGLLVLMTATSAIFFASAKRANNTSQQSRGFMQSGQMLDEAVQGALFDLNENQASFSAGFPQETAPRAVPGSTATWWMDAPTPGSAMAASKLHVSGTFIDAKRQVSIDLYRAQVGSVTQGTDDGAISYSLAPVAAWSHALVAQGMTLHGATGSTSTDVVTGSIGTTGNAIATATTRTNAAPIEPSGGYTRYGKSGSDWDASTYPRPRDVAAAFTLDTNFATQVLDQCTTSLGAWKASENGGSLYADGNLGCYSSMDFDVNTTIRGAGVASAIVSGPVTFNANVAAATTAQLNIIATGTTGDITFPGTANRLVNAFIYAPDRTCATTSDASRLAFTGSMVCKQANLTGSLTWKAPLADSGNFVGANTYNRTVWFLGPYAQTSGQYEG